MYAVYSVWCIFADRSVSQQCKKSGFTIQLHRTNVPAVWQNKIIKCAHKLFSFLDLANGGINYVTPAIV